MHITRKIKNIIKAKPILFTTPGHMQGFHSMGEFVGLFGREVFKGDFAEIEGMDNLQNPQDVILKSLQNAAEIYDVKNTFYLVNGSTSGILALMLATARRGEKVLVARNAHKAVINALILSGADPVWVETGWDEEWNIPTGINSRLIEQKLEENPDIKSLWLTSPTYEGVITDIKPIAELCRAKNILLIVDEAHGALWPFSDKLPSSAVHCGADACVQSLHKTGSCLNQGAVLHLSKDSKILAEAVQQALNIINTTSPSYLLLSSIEASIEYLNSGSGRKALNQLINNINAMKTRLKQNTDIVFLENSDLTKIFFGIKNVCAQKLSDFLEEKYSIEVELNNEAGLLAIAGIGTTEKTLKTLETAIKQADKELSKNNVKKEIRPYIYPKKIITPSQAFALDSKIVSPKEAIGHICKESIVQYPPGIPLIIPGERIQEKHYEFIKNKEKIEIVIYHMM